MSIPMEISEQQNPVEVNISDQNGVIIESPALSSPAPAAIPEDKYLVSGLSSYPSHTSKCAT